MKLPFTAWTRQGDLILTSGQGPVDMATGVYTPADFETEARLTLENLRAVLVSAGSTMNQVLRVTVYLASMDDYRTFNRIYLEHFSDPLPARSCIAAAGLAFGMKLELDAIARAGGA
ncbi:MAG TPA: RidA family protein [Candidatus Polarisedimenticolia bacterium]|nr:RidA family protein [Candidatus Polarisedimenticolia bacterium]